MNRRKTAIVIGATSGIGRELALQLMRNGYRVGITGRRKQQLHELKRLHPEDFVDRVFDITDIKSISRHMQSLVNELGGLDLLVLSSGTGDLNEALEFAIEKNTIDTNVIGFTALTDWTFRYFKEQKKGHLVAITSIAGIRGSRLAPAYNASKAYQINYLEGLRQKSHSLRLPIIVTDVRPGFVDTAMAKAPGQFWVADADEASKQIYNAIRKKKKSAYITRRWRIIAIILRMLPKSLYDRM